MKTKMHKSEIVPSLTYWYIYMGGGKCQLLQVAVEEDEYTGQFNVLISYGEDTFKTFPIKIDTDEEGFIEYLFPIDKKADAEIMWSYNFIKEFHNNTYVTIDRFIELNKILKSDYPELILKGL